MRRPLSLLTALALAGCATTPSARAPTAEWLVGSWLMLAGGVSDVSSCESHLPIRYERDGTYHLWEDSGTWTLENGTLTETATELNDQADIAEPIELGRPFVSRVERVGRDRFVKTYSDGERHSFLRCPRVP